jgi:hypothetical protein
VTTFYLPSEKALTIGELLDENDTQDLLPSINEVCNQHFCGKPIHIYQIDLTQNNSKYLISQEINYEEEIPQGHPLLIAKGLDTEHYDISENMSIEMLKAIVVRGYSQDILKIFEIFYKDKQIRNHNAIVLFCQIAKLYPQQYINQLLDIKAVIVHYTLAKSKNPEVEARLINHPNYNIRSLVAEHGTANARLNLIKDRSKYVQKSIALGCKEGEETILNHLLKSKDGLTHRVITPKLNIQQLEQLINRFEENLDDETNQKILHYSANQFIERILKKTPHLINRILKWNTPQIRLAIITNAPNKIKNHFTNQDLTPLEMEQLLKSGGYPYLKLYQNEKYEAISTTYHDIIRTVEDLILESLNQQTIKYATNKQLLEFLEETNNPYIYKEIEHVIQDRREAGQF